MFNDYNSFRNQVSRSKELFRPRSKARAIHAQYKATGFYSFLGDSLKKLIVPVLLIILTLVIIDQFVIDFGIIFHYITESVSHTSMLAIFFASESFLGLLPPDVFIAWTAKTAHPMYWLTLLALLSYAGGIVAYMTGRSLHRIPSVHNYAEVKISRHVKQARKWGGVLIVVGALLPLPFAIASMTAGILKYNFRSYLILGLFRIVRFYLYAAAIYLFI